MMEWVNLTMIHCRHKCKYHNVPPVQLLYANKKFKVLKHLKTKKIWLPKFPGKSQEWDANFNFCLTLTSSASPPLHFLCKERKEIGKGGESLSGRFSADSSVFWFCFLPRSQFWHWHTQRSLYSSFSLSWSF
jgi:hypothetical protein